MLPESGTQHHECVTTLNRDGHVAREQFFVQAHSLVRQQLAGAALLLFARKVPAQLTPQHHSYGPQRISRANKCRQTKKVCHSFMLQKNNTHQYWAFNSYQSWGQLQACSNGLAQSSATSAGIQAESS